MQSNPYEDFDFDLDLEKLRLTSFWQLPAKPAENRLQAIAIESKGKYFIDLNKPEAQALLCQRLRAVKTFEQAKQWRSKYGSVWTGVGIGDTLKLATTLRWIYRLHGLIVDEQTPCLKKHIVGQSELWRAKCSGVTS